MIRRRFKKYRITLFITLLPLQLFAKQIFIANDGNDGATGTESSPLGSITVAIDKVLPGDTVYIRGGTYKLSGARISCNKFGEPGKHYKIWAYPGETPVLDGSSMSSGNNIIHIRGNYWHIKGLVFHDAPDNGMRIGGNQDATGGSYNIIENCVFRYNGDSGLQIGRSATSNPNDGTYAANNLILNCDAHNNFDGSGSNADGFACKLAPGDSNIFRGCRAWENSDDGFDFWASQYRIIVENCWVWHHADPAVGPSGNGNGIKIGGSDNHGPHIIRNCVVFDHHYTSGNNKGIDQNHNLTGVQVYNCLSFDNEYNYSFWERPNDGTKHVLNNNISIAPIITHHWNDSFSDTTNNSWTIAGITADASDYISLSVEDAKAPRLADGSLPNNGFAKLKAGSDLIDKGTNVGLPYSGSAPDLGPYEYGGTSIKTNLMPAWSLPFTAVITGNTLTLKFDIKMKNASVELVDLRGRTIVNFVTTIKSNSGNQQSINITRQMISKGMYLLHVTCDGNIFTQKIAKQ